MTSSDTTARLDSGAASALIALVAGAVALGFSAIFVRLAAAEGIGPFASAFWRVALSLPVLYGWMRLEEAQGPRPRKAFGRATLLAGLAFAGDLFFWHLAILDTTVANATFFATTAPVFVVLVTWLVLRRRVAGATVAGLLLCLLGGAALVGASLALDLGHLRGDLEGVVTAFFFGLYFLAVERARDGAGAGRVTFEASVVTAVVLLPVAVALEPAILPGSAAGWLALIALAWVSHAGGQGLLSVALGRLPATFSSLVIFLEAVATAAFGWIILGERVTLTQGLGGALILGGIYVARPRNGVVPG
ncbi:MAG TPA: DMT family transporter [Beijerinckiaceae bacterium]|nr:DMT family transporter [Beijerinckiaceae bacterium]